MGRGSGNANQRISQRINRRLGATIGTASRVMSALAAVVMVFGGAQDDLPEKRSKVRIRNNTWLKANKKARKRAYASRRYNLQRPRELRIKRQHRRDKQVRA